MTPASWYAHAARAIASENGRPPTAHERHVRNRIWANDCAACEAQVQRFLRDIRAGETSVPEGVRRSYR